MEESMSAKKSKKCPYCPKQKEPGHRTCGDVACLNANWKKQTGLDFPKCPPPKEKNRE